MIGFERVGPDSDPIFRNLYQHYVHDMSEWFGIETRDDGAFAHDTSKLWQGDYAVYLARTPKAVAGFAVVGSAEQWLGTSEARDVKDFFVLRAHRHEGIGGAMAGHIWDAHPAEWIVRVLATNEPAVPFWRQVVRRYSGGACSEARITDEGRDWLHLRFDNSKR